MQVDIFAWVKTTRDPVGAAPGGGVAQATKETVLPSLADPSNLVQLNFWQLKPNEVQTVVWTSNVNRQARTLPYRA